MTMLLIYGLGLDQVLNDLGLRFENSVSFNNSNTRIFCTSDKVPMFDVPSADCMCVKQQIMAYYSDENIRS